MLSLQPVEPHPLVGAGQRRLGSLGQGEVVHGVAAPHGLAFAAGLEALQSELPQRLQHPEAGLTGGPLLGPHEALAGERRHRLHHVARRAAGLGAHRARRLQGEAPDEHRQRAEQAAIGLLEQVVAPLDGPAQGLLPGRQVASAADEQREPAVQAVEEGRRREQLDAGSGELEGQGQPVQPAADGRHVGAVGGGEGEAVGHRPGPGDEQVHGRVPVQFLHRRRRRRRPVRAEIGGRRWQCQGRHVELVLAGQAQGGPARHQRLQARARCQEGGHRRRAPPSGARSCPPPAAPGARAGRRAGPPPSSARPPPTRRGRAPPRGGRGRDRSGARGRRTTRRPGRPRAGRRRRPGPGASCRCRGRR